MMNVYFSFRGWPVETQRARRARAFSFPSVMWTILVGSKRLQDHTLLYARQTEGVREVKDGLRFPRGRGEGRPEEGRDARKNFDKPRAAFITMQSVFVP